MRNSVNFAGFGVGLFLLVLFCFGILQWLNIPTGNFLDWVIGGATFWWLLLIVTVPWNIHFDAKEVLAEAEDSVKKAIKIDDKQLKYVKLVARRSLWVAIGLHIISTVGLYALALAGISVVGYIGSGAALLLTVLRPAIRAYQYLAARLAMVRREFSYPREDVLELRDRFAVIEYKVKELEALLDANNPNSFISQQVKRWEVQERDLEKLSADLKQLKSSNQAEHQKLARDAENAISQLTTDSEVLSHVREIVRFFKEA
ncbi:hypothetical protein [Limnoraphis robusta]|uniref:Uncharacterized protein n=1 Tax=Limnoraphis robusta CS-951 TaxID=1637645 RepID=A0A0F5YMI9_9CYAN|nr:hypothetical protein [Limnoraphis robusta]KKD39882.1 hypothetical protein WN50_00910 [Limnoraphis robusta CS-951]